MRKVETLTSTKTGATTYKVRFRLDGKQTSETFPNKRDAEQFAKHLDALGVREAVDRLYEGETRDKIPVLDDVAADHIRLLTGIEEGTRIGYTRLWGRTWAKLLGRVRADELTADHVRDAVNELAKTYSTKSLENQRGLLSGVVTRCIELGYLTRNPAKGIRLPEGKRVAVDDEDAEDETEMVCLTHVEWDAFYQAFAPHYRPFIRFLVGTGCRWGEAVVLRRRDFDLEARTVRIRRALKWSSDGNRVIGPPKTKKGRRTIVLPPEVIEDVRPLLAGKGPSDLIFTQVRGGLIPHRTFWSKYWKPGIWRAGQCAAHLAELEAKGCKCGHTAPHLCKLHKGSAPASCGCPGTMAQSPRIHDLRHTHASWLLAAGVPIHVVQARLGHESIQTTVDVYSHLLPDAQIIAAEAAGLALSGRQANGSWLTRIESYPDDALRQLAAALAAEAKTRGIDLEPKAISASAA